MSTTNYIVRKLWLNSHFRQETQLWALSRIKQFCPLWGAKPSRFCLRRGGIVPTLKKLNISLIINIKFFYKAVFENPNNENFQS